MDRESLRKMTYEATKGRFGRKRKVCGRAPRRPESAEREYERAADAYVRIVREEIDREMPAIRKAYSAALREDGAGGESGNTRADAASWFFAELERIFTRMRERIESRTRGYGLRHKLESLAGMIRKLTIREWKNAIKATLGVDIREDYYLGGEYERLLLEWVDRNVGLVSTIPQESLGRMREEVMECYEKGATTKELAKRLEREYGISWRHAMLIARDQTAKLNGQISRKQQEDAGVKEYVWYTAMDQRVRDRHRELHGRKFRWDDPPEVAPGRRCHPGEDYQCRCIARPVFELGEVELPLAGSGEEDPGPQEGAWGAPERSGPSFVGQTAGAAPRETPQRARKARGRR